ncbi:MAG: SRPBCC domain-containing protein [Nannocystaceae bacterium]
MSLTEKTAPSQNESLAFEVELRHAPEKVWRALTNPELLAEWLLPAVGLKLEPGATFAFQAEPQPGWDGVVNCRYLEIEAHRRIRWAWVVGDIDTEVTFTLTPTASGTHLALVHSGFRADQKQNFGGARYGWRMMGGKLIALLERIDRIDGVDGADGGA